MNRTNQSSDGITVIIPVYNAETTIENCIRSIFRQTYCNIQIICVNDGSKDKSLDILKKLQKEDSRLYITTQSNGGAASARNVGIRLASYKYITFVDSDDEIEADMYATMIQFMKENELDCVCCDFQIHSSNSKITYIGYSINKNPLMGRKDILEYIVKPLLGFNSYPNDLYKNMWNKIFLRNIILENDIFLDEKKIHGEDWEFCINYYRCITSFGFVHKPFYHYILDHNESLSQKVRMNFLESIFESQNRFRNWYPELDWNSQKKEEDLLYLPIRTALYYRENLKRKEARKKIDDIYDLCVENMHWRLAATNHVLWKPLLQDKSKFDQYIWRKTTIKSFLSKTRRIVKRLLLR